MTEVQKCVDCVPVEGRNGIEPLPLESTFPLGPEIRFRALNAERQLHDPEYLTPEQADYYQRENLICFLCEFAGKVPSKKIPGIFTRKGDLRICNLDVLEMAAKSARIKGPDSREASEFEGYQKVVAGLKFGANRIDIVSPPQLANYMLSFSLEVGDYDYTLEGRPVSQIVTRLDEDMRTLDVSRRVFGALAQNAMMPNYADKFTRPEDFISNPIISNTQTVGNLDRAVALIGISQNEINYSEQYERELRLSLAPMVNHYLELIKELSTISEGGLEFQNGFDELDYTLQTMFSLAKKLSEDMKSTSRFPPRSVRDIVALRSTDPAQYYLEAAKMAQEYRPEIVGGTSCPASVNSSSVNQIASSSLSPPTTFQEILQQASVKSDELKCTCPECGKKVAAKIKNKRITCPACKAEGPYRC